jgi:hypothetical protein
MGRNVFNGKEFLIRRCPALPFPLYYHHLPVTDSCRHSSKKKGERALEARGKLFRPPLLPAACPPSLSFLPSASSFLPSAPSFLPKLPSFLFPLSSVLPSAPSFLDILPLLFPSLLPTLSRGRKTKGKEGKKERRKEGRKVEKGGGR